MSTTPLIAFSSSTIPRTNSISTVGTGEDEDYEVSTVTLNSILWTDRDMYIFANLPSYLVGGILYRTPHRVPAGVELTLTALMKGHSIVF